MSDFEYDGKPITAIEYQYCGRRDGWKPTQVATGGSYYDFDWCKVNRVLCCHNSGGGPDRKTYPIARFVNSPKICAKLWLAEGVKLCDCGDSEKVITRKEARARGYLMISKPLEIEGSPNPFDDAITEESTVWCEVCESHFPSNDGDQVCCHVAYQEGGNGYCLGVGSTEVDIDDARRSLRFLLKTLRPELITETYERLCKKSFNGLSGNDFNFRDYDHERNADDIYAPGIAWLLSLDRKTRGATMLTAGWIWEYQHGQNHRFTISTNTFICRDEKLLQKWIETDESRLAEDSMEVDLRKIKIECANEHRFVKDPKGTEEVLLWPADPGKDSRAVRISVNECEIIDRKRVRLWFGRILSKKGIVDNGA